MLAETLARLDTLSTLIESIRSHYSEGDSWLLLAEARFPYARQALERLAVAEESEDHSHFTDIDLREVRLIELIDRFKPSSELCWLESMFTNAIDVFNLDVFELLHADGRVNFSQNSNKAIKHASSFGVTDAVKILLLDPRVDPSANFNEAIRLASYRGHIAVVNLLLADPRVDPSDLNNDAIYAASKNGHVAVVERLLADPRVDPSAADNYAIRLASNRGHIAVVNLLLADPRVDPSAKNNEALRLASLNRHKDVVALLKPRCKLTFLENLWWW